MELIDKLSLIQAELKAPKNQTNKFGGYSYRSCEDILNAVKPLLKEQKLILTLSDELIQTPTGNYIKVTAMLSDGKTNVTTTSLAREALEQKGMVAAQITGSSSSYARKYALNGLFLIDDTKDADATNTYGKEETAPVQATFKPSAPTTAPATTPRPSFARLKKPEVKVEEVKPSIDDEL